jgi:hypothetical protein
VNDWNGPGNGSMDLNLDSEMEIYFENTCSSARKTTFFCFLGESAVNNCGECEINAI